MESIKIIEHDHVGIKKNVVSLLEVSKSVIKFIQSRSSVTKLKSLNEIKLMLDDYESSITSSKVQEPSKMFRVHYDLYAGLYQKHKEHILTDISGEYVDDKWIRESEISLQVGSNFNKPLGIVFPLSDVYKLAVDIYKKYENDGQYEKECKMLDYFLLYLYRIFGSFKWDKKELDHLKKIEKFIEADLVESKLMLKPQSNSKMSGILGGGNGMPDLSSLISGMGKMFNDPESMKLFQSAFGDVQKDLQNGGDMGTTVASIAAKLYNPSFSEPLKNTISKHFNIDIGAIPKPTNTNTTPTNTNTTPTNTTPTNTTPTNTNTSKTSEEK